MGCDIHTHAPDPKSSTNFQLYYSVAQRCSANCLGHGYGYECHSPFQTGSGRTFLFYQRAPNVPLPQTCHFQRRPRQLPVGVRTNAVITEVPQFSHNESKVATCMAFVAASLAFAATLRVLMAKHMCVCVCSNNTLWQTVWYCMCGTFCKINTPIKQRALSTSQA